ncbi:MAG: T9SS type A sorting domain-containing protein [Ignavibacteriaceae bacterium]|nr:T9SS type A sorting domain-containing protein [Ignavibacteriaceae bacterium]
MKKAGILFSIYIILSSVSFSQTSIFQSGPEMNTKRMGQFSFTLPNGNVVLIGGHGTNFVSLNTAEIYNPTLNKFTQSSMQYIHDMAAACELSDGTWLIAGGSTDLGVAPGITGAEIFNPADGSFTACNSLVYPRCISTAVRLANNDVLIVGGWYNQTSATYGELYEASNKTFYATQALLTPRANAMAIATTDGGAVVFGGCQIYGSGLYESVEYYDPSTGLFSLLQNTLFPADAGWYIENEWFMRPMSQQRMKNGEYLISAIRYYADSTVYTLGTFNPDTKTFAKMDLATPLPNTGDGVSFFKGPLLDTAKNFAYWLAIKNNTDPWEMQLYTINLANKTWKTSGFYTTDYYWTSASINLLPNGNILISGGTTSSDYYTNFNPVDSTIIITGSVTGVNDKQANLPSQFSLSQNYPNPFNPVTIINYSVPKSGIVTISIYDILGREVKALVNEEKTPGNYSVQFNGSNLSSGIYFYHMQSGNFTQTKKLVLMK